MMTLNSPADLYWHAAKKLMTASFDVREALRELGQDSPLYGEMKDAADRLFDLYIEVQSWTMAAESSAAASAPARNR